MTSVIDAAERREHASERWRILGSNAWAMFIETLHERHSPLVDSPEIVAELKVQFYGVIDAVAASAGIIREVPAPEDPSEAIGRSRASSRIHPTQSLQAAGLIFETALPAVAAELSDRNGATPELTAARLLNAAILNRLAAGSRAYGDYLLDKAHGSNRDERRWLSRELHDVAAPSVAVVLQKLELYELYRDTDPDRAEIKLREMRESLLDAVKTIRSISAETRDTVARHGLVIAIERLLGDVPAPIRTGLTTRGDLDVVSLAYREELFLMTREAVRNAVSHAQPTRIDIAIGMTSSELAARIHNDGQHFDVESTLASDRHVGLDSMRERAALLGAALTITSSATGGTSVSIVVPLAGPPTLERRGGPE